MTRWLALLTTCFLTLARSASAGDFEKDKLDNWHHWRGPLATGFAPKGDPPVTWDAKTNIKWKAEADRQGQRNANRLGQPRLCYHGRRDE